MKPAEKQLKIHDISPLLSERIAVFPGDEPFRRKIVMDYAQGHHLRLSSLSSTVHLGAHVDAPSHYHPDGVTMEKRPLERYCGRAQVITVRAARGERILPSHLEDRPILATRVLFKTGSYPNPDRWNGDFNSLSPELIADLSARGVVLVGIDTPSVDPAEDAELLTHTEIYRRDLAILEGIVLDEVRDGLYTLVALPLRLEGADASPVRAVLLENEGSL